MCADTKFVSLYNKNQGISLPTTLYNVWQKAFAEKPCFSLGQHYWWPGFDKQVEYLVRDCHMCASNAKLYKTCQAPLTPSPPPKGPWQKGAMDIMGPFKTGKYALVLIDYFSKWCEVESVTDVTMSLVIKFLLVHEGYPKHNYCHGQQCTVYLPRGQGLHLFVLVQCRNYIWIFCKEPYTLI